MRPQIFYALGEGAEDPAVGFLDAMADDKSSWVKALFSMPCRGAGGTCDASDCNFWEDLKDDLNMTSSSSRARRNRISSCQQRQETLAQRRDYSPMEFNY